MKIFFLIRSLNIGGAERQLLTLATGLHQRGSNVQVIVFAGGGVLESDLQKAGIPVWNLGRSGIKSLPLVFLRLWSILHAERPEVLYSFLQVANLWSGVLRIFMPRLKVVWGHRASMDTQSGGFWGRLSFLIEILLAHKVDWHVTNSHTGSLFIEERGYPKDRISIIPNGIDIEKFKPRDGSALKIQWGVTPSQKLIGFVGRLDPVKAHPVFLQAAAFIAQSRTDICFMCVGGGEGDYVAKLKDMSNKLGLGQIMIWTGELQDMSSVYSMFDVLVLASVSEGFPNSILEAMACGVPCVATDVGDASVIVQDLGEIVPVNDVTELGDKILFMLRRISDEPSLKLQVRQHVVEKYSVSRLVETTSKKLEDLLKEKSSICVE